MIDSTIILIATMKFLRLFVEHKKILILIPSRYNSSRFEGKPLAPIKGKSLIQRVYEGCLKSKDCVASKYRLEIEVCVVTDDDRIENHVKEFAGNVVRVDDDVASGTLRIKKAFERYYLSQGQDKKIYDVIINVQGDEPLIDAKDIITLSEFHILSDYSISTIVKPESMSNRDIENPDKVKAIYSKDSGRCHFFTRAEVPFDRDSENQKEANWFLHVGVYAYSPESLENYCQLKPAYYENIEKLEQLRAIENNMTIGAIETHHEMISIDRPEDIQKLEGVLCE